MKFLLLLLFIICRDLILNIWCFYLFLLINEIFQNKNFNNLYWQLLLIIINI